MRTFNEFMESITAVKGQEIIVGNVKLKIVKDTDTSEYIVRWIENGKVNDDKSYYTNDLKDAIGTLKLMAKEIN